MLKIKPLSEELVSKIAAGEVVERPASVLKELIENSLDAKATQIDIYLEKGGKRLIQVIDNGEGIHPEDMLYAVKRYATSKIFSEEDLYSINSYGFRGEALYSISSVSKFSIVSRPENYPLGKELYIEGGIFKTFSDTGASIGTKVQVKDLFFNLPARQKFLKSERTEFIHCLKVFINYAVLHFDKHFRLVTDGKEYLNLPPTSIEKRISDIFPKISDKLVRFGSENELGEVYGYLVVDERFKREGIIYVNNRPVKNKELIKLMRSVVGEKFYVLFINLPPYFVDHNIHPAKLEVKFKKDVPVFQLVRESIKSMEKPFRKKTEFSYTLAQKVSDYISSDKKFEILGQIENTFIVVYFDGDLYLIDQHVVHERINYEILLKDILKNGMLYSKKLEKSINIKISHIEIEKIKENSEILKKAGFSFEIYGDNLKVTAVPSYISENDAVDVIFKIIETEYPVIVIEDIIGEIACKSSMTAGDVLTSEEAKILLKNWLETDNPNLCPHGRPVYYKISIDEVKKIVGRG
ncbi:DNA mismatch repair endonuclease MutL [Persephonella sp.]